MITDEEKQKLDEVVRAAFGQPYEAHRELHGVDVVLRTLYDTEVKDALHRGMLESNAAEQLHQIERWKLAYGLLAVGGVKFPEDVEDKRKIMDGFINIYVNMLLQLFDEICSEELVVVDTLKKYTGIQESPST